LLSTPGLRINAEPRNSFFVTVGQNFIANLVVVSAYTFDTTVEFIAEKLWQNSSWNQLLYFYTDDGFYHKLQSLNKHHTLAIAFCRRLLRPTYFDYTLKTRLNAVFDLKCDLRFG